MSTAKFNQWLNSDGTENYKCRAWVNFNGTGTVAIRASGNVSSITDNGTGDYTVNFTNAMVDANYSVTASCALDSLYNNNPRTVQPVSTNSSSTRMRTLDAPGGTPPDVEFVFVSIFR